MFFRATEGGAPNLPPFKSQVKADSEHSKSNLLLLIMPEYGKYGRETTGYGAQNTVFDVNQSSHLRGCEEQ